MTSHMTEKAMLHWNRLQQKQAIGKVTEDTETRGKVIIKLYKGV